MLFESSNVNLPLEVENYVKDQGGRYIDAIVDLCEKYNIDPTVAAKHMSQPIIEKLKLEGQEMNMLPKTSRLPF